MEITLENIRAKIVETEGELKELKAAYAVMTRLAGETVNPSIEKKTGDLPNLSDSGDINIQDLDLPPMKTKSTDTLASNIKTLITRFGDQEFTVTHVEVALKGIGKGSDAKHFRNRVSVIIKQLAEDDVLTRTFTGKGNVPHKYANTKKPPSRRTRFIEK